MLRHEEIRRIRRALNLTQLQLATRIGRSTSWLSLLESGLAPMPDRRSLERLAVELGVSLDSLVSEGDPNAK